AVSGFIALTAIGVAIYATKRTGGVPMPALVWLVVSTVAVLGAVLLTRRSRNLPAIIWTMATSAVLGWQGLLIAYTGIPPVRSSYELVVATKPYVGPRTQLFSVGQYRPTLSPYLERIIEPVEFVGELEFGLTQEPDKRLTPESFLERWQASSD